MSYNLLFNVNEMVSTVNGLNVKAINIFAGFLIIGDNCVVFENFTASIGDLMVSN
jgi:hypothetical protein